MFSDGKITKTVVFIDDGERYLYFGDPSERVIQLLQLKEVVNEDGRTLYCVDKITVDGMKMKYFGQAKTTNDVNLAIYAYSYNYEMR